MVNQSHRTIPRFSGSKVTALSYLVNMETLRYLKLKESGNYLKTKNI